METRGFRNLAHPLVSSTRTARRVPLRKALLLVCGVPLAPEGVRAPAPRGREALPAIPTMRALRWSQGKKGEVSVSRTSNPLETGLSVPESFPAVPDLGEFAGRSELAGLRARTRLQTRVPCPKAATPGHPVPRLCLVAPLHPTAATTAPRHPAASLGATRPTRHGQALPSPPQRAAHELGKRLL